ncbi:MAG TPA: hypothetical protein VFR47_01485 [Anaerolineales bacterium]|nr:hypothetical protein [Anaerolineales bacterium]
MANPYVIQLVGVLLTAAGLAALTASAYVYGRSLRRDEKQRMGRERKDMRRLPMNVETIASTAFVLIGLGILNWSNFNICAYLAYWLPSFSSSIKFWLACQ